MGAWADAPPGASVLDVGTGTGLMALMIAQRCGETSFITAIEPDQSSFDLAWKNVRQSLFSERIKVINTSFENFQPTDQFDLIICNPPFFEKSLKPATQQRTRERHSESLPFQNLLEGAKWLLRLHGCLAVILPVTEGNRFEEVAKALGFIIKKKTAVFTKPGKPQERWLLEFTQHLEKPSTENTMTIQKNVGEWTDDYRLLTQDFYLDF